MKTLFMLLGFIFGAGGLIGHFSAQSYMENHPALQMKTTLSDFFGQSANLAQLTGEDKVNLFLNDYGLTMAMVGGALILLGLLWPSGRRRR